MGGSAEDVRDSEKLNIGPLDNLPAFVPLREAVFLSLKKAILDGSLRPGQTLSENKIADRLSVSRTPVREAIRVLEAEGLVTFLPGRKVVVSAPTKKDIEEVYEIRLIVETEALRRITPDRSVLIRTLEEHLDEAEKCRKEGNLQEMAEANSRFHATIISALENDRMQRFIDSLQDTIFRLRTYSLTEEWAVEPSTLESEKEHRQIVASLKMGDMESAMSLLRQNLTKPKQMLSTSFHEKNGPLGETGYR